MKTKKLINVLKQTAAHSASMVEYWELNAAKAADAGVDGSFLDLIFSIQEAAERDSLFWSRMAAAFELED